MKNKTRISQENIMFFICGVYLFPVFIAVSILLSICFLDIPVIKDSYILASDIHSEHTYNVSLSSIKVSKHKAPKGAPHYYLEGYDPGNNKFRFEITHKGYEQIKSNKYKLLKIAYFDKSKVVSSITVLE